MTRFSARFCASTRPFFCVLTAGLLLAAAPVQAALVYALTDENDLLTFDSATPADLIDAGAISGLGGQDLVGIDLRPANRRLYGVGNLGGIFQIDPSTKVATQVSSVGVPLSGSRFGLDFNPVVDRLRIVSDLEQNLRVNVDTGATIVDVPLQYGPGQPGATGDNPNVVGSAYTNSFGTPASTTLYGIDVRASEDRLVIQNPPNAGTLTVVGFGTLNVNASALQGFDILSGGFNNTGFAAIQTTSSGISQLYTINLASGGAGLIGSIGGGDLIDGITLDPIPEPTTFGLLGLATIGVVVARRRTA